MKEYLIRYAKKEDILSINALSQEMHRYMGDIVGLKFSDEELEDENVRASELKGIIVAEEKSTEKIIGYLSFNPKPAHDEWYGKHLYIYEIGVHKVYQGKGIGRELVEHIISLARKRRLNVKIDTLSRNGQTIKFYKKLGFRPYMTYFIKEHRKRLKI